MGNRYDILFKYLNIYTSAKMCGIKNMKIKKVIYLKGGHGPEKWATGKFCTNHITHVLYYTSLARSELEHVYVSHFTLMSSGWRIYVSQVMSRWQRFDCIFWASRRSCRRSWAASWCLCVLVGEDLLSTTWTMLKPRPSALAARLGFGFRCCCFGLFRDSFWTWTHTKGCQQIRF